jgi:hypothetical protein
MSGVIDERHDAEELCVDDHGSVNFGLNRIAPDEMSRNSDTMKLSMSAARRSGSGGLSRPVRL